MVIITKQSIYRNVEIFLWRAYKYSVDNTFLTNAAMRYNTERVGNAQ